MSFLTDLKKDNTNYRERIFPGTNEKIKIRVLTGAEAQQCAVNADLWMREHHGVQYSDFLGYVFSEEYDWQVLFLAVRCPDDNPIADDILQFRAKVTESERAALIKEYNDVQNECAPQIDTMSQEEFKALVERVKKKPSETVPSIYGTSLLRRLLVTMASQPSSSPTGKS